MPRLAIVAALEREVRPLVKGWRVTDKEHNGRFFRFFENAEVVLVCGGIGAAAARRASEAVISIFDPKVVCSAGFAGALDPKLHVGDLVRPSFVINAGDSSRTVIEGGEGVLVSFGSVASPSQKVKLRDSFGADAVDMEAAAVARSAEARHKEFTVVKAVSDEMDFEFPAMERFIDADGRFSQGGFAWYAAIRPWLWPRVMRLARNSNRASRALCAYLDTIGA
ncbi:MAG: phosphorylase [Acidobacteria bacterium]|nr:MAG: phosphorylase [Acidobacteriota bacterium]